MSFEWQVQTVSENDKDSPAVVVDKPAPIDEYAIGQEFRMLKMLLDKKSIALHSWQSGASKPLIIPQKCKC